MTDAQKLSTIADIIREDASIDIHFEITNADELARRILAAISLTYTMRGLVYIEDDGTVRQPTNRDI